MTTPSILTGSASLDPLADQLREYCELLITSATGTRSRQADISRMSPLLSDPIEALLKSWDVGDGKHAALLKHADFNADAETLLCALAAYAQLQADTVQKLKGALSEAYWFKSIAEAFPDEMERLALLHLRKFVSLIAAEPKSKRARKLTADSNVRYEKTHRRLSRGTGLPRRERVSLIEIEMAGRPETELTADAIQTTQVDDPFRLLLKLPSLPPSPPPQFSVDSLLQGQRIPMSAPLNEVSLENLFGMDRKRFRGSLPRRKPGAYPSYDYRTFLKIADRLLSEPPGRPKRWLADPALRVNVLSALWLRAKTISRPAIKKSVRNLARKFGEI